MLSEKSHHSLYSPTIPEEETLFLYSGPIKLELLTEMMNEVRTLFQQNALLQFKVFSIMVELGQNMLSYSEEMNLEGNKDRFGTIRITETDKFYNLITGNLVSINNGRELLKKCELINTMNMQDLRKYKRKLRLASAENKLSNRGGIGLVQVALISENPLTIMHEEVDENYTFFLICTKIAKQ